VLTSAHEENVIQELQQKINNGKKDTLRHSHLFRKSSEADPDGERNTPDEPDWFSVEVFELG
jgi:hypothetical protein